MTDEIGESQQGAAVIDLPYIQARYICICVVLLFLIKNLTKSNTYFGIVEKSAHKIKFGLAEIEPFDLTF